MKPWALLPFELIKHADEHAKSGSDFDRRMALIGFDNAIEVAIITFLSLNPIQRDNHQFSREQVSKWEKDFHSKLRFLDHFVTAILKQPMKFEKDEIVFYHDIRNDMYHGGIGVVPAVANIYGVRSVALWVFKTLFKIDAEILLEGVESSAMQPVEVSNDMSEASSTFSDRTKFLELFISIRRDLNMLMRISGEVDSSDVTQVPPIQAWQRLFSKGDETPSTYQEALRDAEALRTEIVEGQSSQETKSNLKTLSDTLAAVSGLIRSELQDYQVAIVEKSLESTLLAARPEADRRAGIVWQTPGSGITASMIAYIKGVLSLRELENVVVLVASDRNDLMEQTLSRIDVSGNSRAERIANGSELADLLKSNEKKLAFTTIQKLLSIKDQGPFEGENIIFIGNNLQTSNNYIKRILPNAIFILFTTTFAPEAVSVYGDLIARYSLKQAIEDKIASPVSYEMRNLELPPKTVFADVETSSEHPFRNPLALERISAIAADLVQHFEKRSTNPLDKAVVVTSRIDYANQLFQSVQNIKPNWAEQGVVFAVSSLLNNQDRQSLLTRFRNQHDPFRIAIISSTLLPLIETAKVKTAYLANTLPKNAVIRTIGLVSRGSTNEPGLVVDYDNNLKVIREAFA